MFERQQIKKILARAQEIDPGCEAFGASKHRYQFRPPLAADFVRKAEGQYGFRLPEDYFRFITEIGDGGAGPGYGIGPFAAASFQHLALPFELRPMQPDEVEEYAITSAENYAKSPERYFVYAEPDEDSPCAAAGFLVLGTHSCQWDFGLITAGRCSRLTTKTAALSSRRTLANTIKIGLIGWRTKGSCALRWTSGAGRRSRTFKLRRYAPWRRKVFAKLSSESAVLPLFTAAFPP